MTLFMETTDVPVHRTAGEIQAYLADCGASKIMQAYNEDRRITGLEFSITITGGPGAAATTQTRSVWTTCSRNLLRSRAWLYVNSIASTAESRWAGSMLG